MIRTCFTQSLGGARARKKSCTLIPPPCGAQALKDGSNWRSRRLDFRMFDWYSLASNAVSHAVGSYLGSSRSSPTVHCVVECPPPSPVNEGLLDILRDQLARCGPQNLTLPSASVVTRTCPSCFGTVVLALIVGLIVGAGAGHVAHFVVASCSRGGGEAAPAVAKLRPAPPIADVAERTATTPSGRGRARAPPGSLAVLRDASAEY